MSKNPNKKDLLLPLRKALERRFAKIDVFTSNSLADVVVNSLLENKDILGVGESVMELENIFKIFPVISPADRNTAAAILNRVTFIGIDQKFHKAAREEFHKAAREEIVDFLTALSRIKEEEKEDPGGLPSKRALPQQPKPPFAVRGLKEAVGLTRCEKVR